MSLPNYITREGAERMQEELRGLCSKERPKIVQEVADAAAQGDRSENAEYIYGKKKLREIDRRIHYLTKRLDAAMIVEPREGKVEQIFFGAWVEVEDEEGAKASYRIVGEDEIDLDRGHVSWRSPIGKVLLKRKVGDTVTLRKPSGEVDLTVLVVRYV